MKMVLIDGGTLGYLFGPQTWWDLERQCFMDFGGVPLTADYVDYDGPGCTGNAYFGGVAVTAGSLDIRFRCFSLPKSPTPRFGRFTRPFTFEPYTIVSQGISSLATCVNAAPPVPGQSGIKFLDLGRPPDSPSILVKDVVDLVGPR